jgi:hypothetical protein
LEAFQMARSGAGDQGLNSRAGTQRSMANMPRSTTRILRAPVT